MTRKIFIFLFLQLWIGAILAQHSPYSLQAAVDALRKHEAQLALKENLNSPGRHEPLDDDDSEYWDGDDEPSIPYAPINRLKINQLLARQLAKERNYENEFENDNYLPDEKKRSFFRERDEKFSEPSYPSSVFREREIDEFYNRKPDLVEEFLREIQKEKEYERQAKFREQLRHLWNNIEDQENEIKDDLFDMDDNNYKKIERIDDIINENDKNKRTNEINSYYTSQPMMERKRSYPVLPWLPVSMKSKRFPVTKRSPKMLTNDNIDDSNVSGTNEKVAKDLQAIFGGQIISASEDKKKRSTTNEGFAPNEKIEKIISKYETNVTSNFENLKNIDHKENSFNLQYHNNKQNSDHEYSQENSKNEKKEIDKNYNGINHINDEHNHNSDNDDHRKKKRATLDNKKRTNLEVIKEDQIIPGDLNDIRNKKSIQWSKYFGIDRRKKSNSFSIYDGNDNKKDNDALSIENDDKDRKSLDPEKLQNMDNKLKSIEDYIIDEAVKYTGAHEGITDPDDIRRLKDHVISRLATAYNLEKMRVALEKLRQSVDNENHLQRNEIEANVKKEMDKEKRVAVKKEGAEFDHSQHAMNAPMQQDITQNVQPNRKFDNSNDEITRKNKRTDGENYHSQQYSMEDSSERDDLGDFEDELGAGHFEPLNDAYLMGNKIGGSSSYNTVEDVGPNQCPLLDIMVDRCRGIDILSGDIHQELLPPCSVHQLCYLCGTSQVACDFQYLSEADSICGHNSECQSAARSALMILRGSPGPQLGPKECLKNPCLYKAMREIGL